MGFPGFLGPLVGIAEVVAAVLLLIGMLNRWSTSTLGAIVFVAIVGVQIPGASRAGKLLTAGLERDLLLRASLVVLYVLGPGRPAPSPTGGSSHTPDP